MRGLTDLWRRWGGLRLLAAGVLLVGSLVAVESGLHWLAGRGAAAGGGRWIWSAEAEAGEGPVTVYAVRDFTLDRVPRWAVVRVMADEEIHLLINRKPVASRHWEDTERAALYPVADALEVGENRIVAELRSGRGVGGFFLRLEVDGRVVAASDADWRITRRFDSSMLAAGAPLPESAAPLVWGRPPAGRWSLARPERLDPLYERIKGGAWRFAPRVRIGPGGSGWSRIERAPDWESPELGTEVTFDWGEPVTGYLNLVFARTETGRGLFWAGDRPVERGRWPPSGYFSKAPGARSWGEARVRRFRFVTVWSDTPLVGARVFPVDPESGARLAVDGQPLGLLGLAPPERPLPAERRIRAELEALAEAEAEAEAAGPEAETGSEPAAVPAPVEVIDAPAGSEAVAAAPTNGG